MPRAMDERTRRPARPRQRVIHLEPVPAGRMRIVYAFLCLGLIGLAGRMAWLQVVQSRDLEARARSLQTQRTDPLGTRRPIVDRSGRLVALD
ncbi:MAG: penicillin-binding protein 2, partial [Synechococcaceae bacterium WB9_4xB_025]|nr:penicillin-binding protein 2 [Synechococcaceae bacterium WB9_4xB_025]